MRCDNDRPCQRCRKRKITCTIDSLSQLSPQRRRSSHSEQQDDSHSAGLPLTAEDGVVPDFIEDHTRTSPHTNTALESIIGVTPIVGADEEHVPYFFEQIMVPEQAFIGADLANFPPDISNLLPDQDWLGEADIFGSDFAPTIDVALHLPFLDDSASPATVELVTTGDPIVHSLNDSDHARRRHAIFQRSLWLWVPESHHNAFSEHNDIQLDESVRTATSPHQPLAETLAISDSLSMRSRDRILQLILKTAKSQISVSSFPSAECLELLLKIGIAKRIIIDAWIHPFTFRSEDTRPELLAALVAAGCVCFGVESISRTGLVLLEIARRGLYNAVEDDISASRDLQYLQASMLWLDICAFCGFKRKMEIAESNLQPLVTALRRFGMLDRAAYHTQAPLQSDSDERLEQKWHEWIKVQSFSRLVYHLFEHDLMMTITKQRSPLISYAELSLPLPASMDLWMASSAHVWRTRYLAGSQDKRQGRLSLRDLLSNGELVHCLPQDIDRTLSTSIYLYGIAAQIWAYHQQVLIQGGIAHPDVSTGFLSQALHQKLYHSLQITSLSSVDFPLAKLLHEYLLLSLHVSVDDVMRFAGKCGEEEAHRAYQALQTWFESKSARTAVFHASQVLRAARTVQPYQLRGCDAFLIYHTVMVLWVFGMMHRDIARRTRQSSPLPNSRQGSQIPFRDGGSINEPDVFLDGPKSFETESFVQMNIGRPCLQLLHLPLDQPRQQGDSAVCDIYNPNCVLRLGIQVLEGNCPSEQRPKMPQMIKTLCNLMSELASLR